MPRTGPRGPRFTQEEKDAIENIGLPLTAHRKTPSKDAVRDAVDMHGLPIFFVGKKGSIPEIVNQKIQHGEMSGVQLDFGKETIRRSVESLYSDLFVLAYMGGILVIEG